MDWTPIEAVLSENKPQTDFDLADLETREFVDHLVALLALDYVQRMRGTSDPADLAALETPVETLDPRR